MECVKIIYYKEEERREIEFQKLKKKIGGAKKLVKSVDVPIDTVVWSVSVLLFKQIYVKNVEKKEARAERLRKERIAAAKKKKRKPKPKAKGKEAADDDDDDDDEEGGEEGEGEKKEGEGEKKEGEEGK